MTSNSPTEERQQWEYIGVKVEGTIEQIIPEFNKLGEAGWNFCWVYYLHAIFKRPITTTP